MPNRSASACRAFGALFNVGTLIVNASKAARFRVSRKFSKNITKRAVEVATVGAANGSGGGDRGEKFGERKNETKTAGEADRAKFPVALALF